MPDKILHDLALPAFVLVWLTGCTAAPGAAEGPWSHGAPMPTARSEIAVTQLAGRIYVAGGIGRFGTTDAFEVYDPATNA